MRDKMEYWLNYWFANLCYRWKMEDRYLAAQRDDKMEASQCLSEAMHWQGVLTRMQMNRRMPTS